MDETKYNAAEVMNNLKGLSYPADRDQILEQAKDNDASKEVMDLLREKLPEGEQFESTAEVLDCLSDTGEMEEMDE